MDELSGQELDQAVAEAIGIAHEADTTPRNHNATISFPSGGKLYFFRPSSSWNDGGPLIERFRVELIPVAGRWTANVNPHGIDRWDGQGIGKTPLIAAMRAILDAVNAGTLNICANT